MELTCEYDSECHCDVDMRIEDDVDGLDNVAFNCDLDMERDGEDKEDAEDQDEKEEEVVDEHEEEDQNENENENEDNGKELRTSGQEARNSSDVNVE